MKIFYSIFMLQNYSLFFFFFLKILFQIRLTEKHYTEKLKDICTKFETLMKEKELESKSKDEKISSLEQKIEEKEASSREEISRLKEIIIEFEVKLKVKSRDVQNEIMCRLKRLFLDFYECQLWFISDTKIAQNAGRSVHKYEERISEHQKRHETHL